MTAAGASLKPNILICFYTLATEPDDPETDISNPESELYDVEQDSLEMHNVYDNHAYAGTVK